jgi:hypothetical protein
MAYSTDWQPVTPLIGMQPIQSVSTTQNHPLGTRVRAVDRGSNSNGEGEFIYVKGVSSGALGAWAGINADDFSTTLATANGIYPLIGIMMSVLDATTDYGWCQISGKAVGLALTGFADNANVYLTGTAGSVDDTDVAGDYVTGAKGASALDGPATGMAEFEIHYPSTDDALDD